MEQPPDNIHQIPARNQPDPTTPLLEAALAYAARGWPVFPLHTPVQTGCSCGHADCTSIGKHPRTKHGLKDATTDEPTIRAWWKQWPDANIGLVTGQASGFMALDIDPYHAGDLTLADLEATHGQLPDTVEQQTGGGGRHFLFKHPGGLVRNDAGKKLGAGLDIRGDGGYIVAPPSLHASGRRYVWEATSRPEDLPLAEVPGWLLTLLQGPSAPRNGRPADAGAAILDGQRNVTLTSLAGSMRRRGMTPQEIYAALAVVNAERCHPPLEAAQVRKIVESIGRYDPGVANESSDQRTGQPPPIHLTDRGNALRLVKAHGQDLHYIYRWKKWLVWDGTRWVVDEGHRVEALAKGVIVQLYAEAKAIIDRLSADVGAESGDEAQARRAQQLEIASAMLKWALKSESAERLSGLLKQARSEDGIAITPDQLDANPWLLNCANGTLDLQAGTLHPHRREDLCTKRLDVAYDPQARCPQWEAFLWRIMGGPTPDNGGDDPARGERAQRLISYLQRATGYSLTGVIREQVLQFMYGSGDNGKTTFSETLAALMGEYFQKAPQELLMRKARPQSGGPSPEIARLCGVRLVIASEVDAKHRLNEAQVKDLTGDDTLTARGLYEDYVQFKPTHKLWMYGNHKPVIVGTDDAIWKRPKLIPFTETIPKAEQQADLRETALLPELPGILAWAVRGCLAWQRGGLQEPLEVQGETQKYRNEMDLLAGFLQDRCEADRLSRTRGLTLHSAYLAYTEGDKEAYLSARKFYGRLRERGYDSYPGTDNKTEVIGLKLKPTTADEAEN